MNDTVMTETGPEKMTKRAVVRRAATPMEMLDRALANGTAPEVLSQLMALQERWQRNAGRMAFAAAVSAAKAELPKIIKKRKVDYTGPTGKRTSYEYEGFADIAEVLDPVLGRHGLSYRYNTDSTGELIVVTCIIEHSDGYSEENKLSAPRDASGNKNAIQAIGSTVTFLQRYTLKAALGLAAAPDDDARAVAAPETISPAQLDALTAKITETGADMGKLLAFLKLESLRDLPADRYDGVLVELRLAAERRAAKAKTEAVTA